MERGQNNGHVTLKYLPVLIVGTEIPESLTLFSKAYNDEK